AGSIGPIGASYRPDLHPAPAEAVATYTEIVNKLAPAVDVLLFETVSCAAHARDALTAAKPSGKPIWISVTVDDRDGSRLRSGEPVRDVLDVTEDADAVLINCSTPEVIPAALAELAAAPQPIGAYANGFENISDGFLSAKPTVDTLTTRCDFSPALYADHVMAWVDAGATIVGGCCEVSPAHIAEIARRLRDAGHTIV
ncbi:MAG: homocysteine S-methyltransferase family protein, partial [Pseudomonadota bacterium]